MRECEVKINDLFNDFETLTVPTSAFITFESDDSATFGDLIDNKQGDQNLKLLEQKFEFQNCSEPTDIIWENRHFTNNQYFWRGLFVFIIVGILLLGSLIIIYVISAFSMNLAAVFPPTDCAGIEAAYGDSLEVQAVNDYDFIMANEGKPSSGTLQCMC